MINLNMFFMESQIPSSVYAERLGVDEIVDLATLTGACTVALVSIFSSDF